MNFLEGLGYVALHVIGAVAFIIASFLMAMLLFQKQGLGAYIIANRAATIAAVISAIVICIQIGRVLP
jgi:hypothetical protein